MHQFLILRSKYIGSDLEAYYAKHKENYKRTAIKRY